MCHLIKYNNIRKGNAMKDPHVEILYYKLKTPETTIYENPPVVKFIRNEFESHLEDGILTCQMREHFPTVKEARRVVEDFLHSWEIKADLEVGHGEIRFQFKDSHVIDRDPPPPGTPKKVCCSGTAILRSNFSAILHARRRKYPDPPTVFKVTPDVEILWRRYKKYLDGKAELLPMAYACLTFVETKAGGRESAAKLYLISNKILETLGNLTFNLGDDMTARKYHKKRNIKELSGKEIKWIEAALKLLIQRTGELENIQLIQPITMNDLPKVL